jgi:hypothetical protein
MYRVTQAQRGRGVKNSATQKIKGRYGHAEKWNSDYIDIERKRHVMAEFGNAVDYFPNCEGEQADNKEPFPGIPVLPEQLT